MPTEAKLQSELQRTLDEVSEILHCEGVDVSTQLKPVTRLFFVNYSVEVQEQILTSLKLYKDLLTTARQAKIPLREDKALLTSTLNLLGLKSRRKDEFFA